MKNYSELSRLERLQELKATIVELINEGVPLPETLDNINKEIEKEQRKAQA